MKTLASRTLSYFSIFLKSFVNILATWPIKLCRILRISGKLNSDKVASTIVINSYVNILPKNGEIFFGLIFQINIRNFRDFRKLRFAIFAAFAICEIAISAISQITQFGFESFLQLWFQPASVSNYILGCIIPPLPSKQAVKGVLDRFSVEFVTKRCHGLNQFLRRVGRHPKLNRSKALKSFLTLSSTDFTIMRKK